MKTLLTLTAALIGAIALPTLAFAGQTADGCASAPSANGGWSVVVDPDSCATKTGGGSIYLDTDGDGNVDAFENDKDR